MGKLKFKAQPKLNYKYFIGSSKGLRRRKSIRQALILLTLLLARSSKHFKLFNRSGNDNNNPSINSNSWRQKDCLQQNNLFRKFSIARKVTQLLGQMNGIRKFSH